VIAEIVEVSAPEPMDGAGCRQIGGGVGEAVRRMKLFAAEPRREERPPDQSRDDNGYARSPEEPCWRHEEFRRTREPERAHQYHDHRPLIPRGRATTDHRDPQQHWPAPRVVTPHALDRQAGHRQPHEVCRHDVRIASGDVRIEREQHRREQRGQVIARQKPDERVHSQPAEQETQQPRHVMGDLWIRGEQPGRHRNCRREDRGIRVAETVLLRVEHVRVVQLGGRDRQLPGNARNEPDVEQAVGVAVERCGGRRQCHGRHVDHEQGAEDAYRHDVLACPSHLIV